ncbi:MAG: hypothetical protein F9K46_14005 [Anaerolineae bacterium]|nr:MAG: hypothetical protein F9K46_14005 [Anaerolineae bacterium]
MFDPTLETPAVPAPIAYVFEVNIEDAIQDQYLAWRDQSYGFLMNVLGGSRRSEVEISAARQLLLDRDWQVKYSEFFEDAYAYVHECGGTWTRLFKEDLRQERWAMVGVGEPQLEALFTDLMDRIDEARDAACEREDRAYPARSAGRFARPR